jgi:hypothetical protein
MENVKPGTYEISAVHGCRPQYVSDEIGGRTQD